MIHQGDCLAVLPTLDADSFDACVTDPPYHLTEIHQRYTVKPVALMAWLVKLVTPPHGVVLDPFLGSGTTAIAAIGNGFRWVGIEREPEYVAIAEQRIGLGCEVRR